jgi:hypothetical protein
VVKSGFYTFVTSTLWAFHNYLAYKGLNHFIILFTTLSQILNNPKQPADKSPIGLYITALAFAILISIAITTIALKKKRK